MIPGYATVQETTAYGQRHADFDYLPLGAQGVRVSQAGFGCYRVDVSVEEHRQALKRALEAGINLIDTSVNYSDGGSEELVGRVLAEMIEAGTIRREEVVVVSKVGYLQGQNDELSQARKAEGRPFPDLVLYAKGLEHCIHPEFIEDQLTRSLHRLQLETLDCYLLHNPEYYLGWAKNAGLELEAARAEYERRIELAFRHLEGEVARGRIRSYGISSNSFPTAATDSSYTSLENVWAIARRIAPDHHFQVIQLPMNLYETGGLTEVNQSTGQTVVEFAASQGLGVLINRPLNAFHNNQLIRLADIPLRSGGETQVERIPTLLRELTGMEHEAATVLLPQLCLNREAFEQAVDRLSAGVLLQQHWQNFSSLEHWQEVQRRFLIPTVQQGIQMVLQHASQTAGIADWVESYVERVNQVMSAVTEQYQQQAARGVEAIKSRVRQAEAQWDAGGTLSQMAIRALRSSMGITTVLVGMRQDEYVDDVVQELRQSVERRDRQSAWMELRNSQHE